MTTDFLHPTGGPIVGPNLGEICKCLYLFGKIMKYGGGGGIRTHGRLSPTSVFKTGAFNHSATPPLRPII